MRRGSMYIVDGCITRIRIGPFQSKVLRFRFLLWVWKDGMGWLHTLSISWCPSGVSQTRFVFFFSHAQSDLRSSLIFFFFSISPSLSSVAPPIFERPLNSHCPILQHTMLFVSPALSHNAQSKPTSLRVQQYVPGPHEARAEVGRGMLMDMDGAALEQAPRLPTTEEDAASPDASKAVASRFYQQDGARLHRTVPQEDRQARQRHLLVVRPRS